MSEDEVRRLAMFAPLEEPGRHGISGYLGWRATYHEITCDWSVGGEFYNAEGILALKRGYMPNEPNWEVWKMFFNSRQGYVFATGQQALDWVKEMEYLQGIRIRQ